MAFIDLEVRRLTGRAIHQHDMLEDGDHVTVAVSGGKDSMLLLWLLRERLSRIPIRYTLTAVHVDPGFDAASADRLEEFFRREGFDHRVIRTDHGLRAHSPENRENPCFLCARLRRTVLFKTAGDLNCRKIAFGHNQDDFAETFLMNIIYGGQVSGMLPRQPFFGGEITVIRPLVLVPAATVERLARRLELPILPSCCPSVRDNKRQEIREFLGTLIRKNPKVRGNICHAMRNVNLEYLPAQIRNGVSGAGERDVSFAVPLIAGPGSSTTSDSLRSGRCTR